MSETVKPEFVIFAPKSVKDLRIQYPELSEYPEFKSSAIKHHDLLFVWWFRCAASPLHDKEDEDKLEECVRRAYPTEQQRHAKLEEFRDRIPDNLKSAFKRMEVFNLEARVENYVYTRMVRDNCKKMLAEDVEGMSPEDKDAWATRAPKLWKLLDETTTTLERGAYGVSAYEDAILDEADGSLRQFRQTVRR